MAGTGTAVTAVSVHGPRGVLDLTVPAGATLGDIARTYALETGAPTLLPLVGADGAPLALGATVAGAGLASGAVLVAVEGSAPAPAPRRPVVGIERGEPLRPGPASAGWMAAAAALAVLAGWTTTSLAPDDRWPFAALLGVAALVGCLPVGALAVQRVLVAPVFAGAAVFALSFEPGAENLPLTLGVAALSAAVVAALGRALAETDAGAEEPLRVWIAAGVVVFVVAMLGSVVPGGPQTTWAVLFVLAVLAARFVPEVAVDVPDQYLLDLERLAVTAWSARELPSGRRGRAVVSRSAVADVAARGARTVDAAAAAVAVVTAVSAPLLLLTATGSVDRIGARLLVGSGALTLLLSARNHRHVLARALLRLGGLVPLAWLALVALGLLPGAGGGSALEVVTAASLSLAVPLLAAAVAVGRGWRSVWWSRRAEVAEAVCGSVAVASLVVAVGLFRHLWEVTS